MMFERMLTEERIKISTTIEINTLETIKRCLMKGIGVSQMPVIS